MRTPRRLLRRTLAALLLASVATSLIVAPAFAGKGGKPSGGTCAVNAPKVIVDNTWAWSQYGSWALAGQSVTYAIDVINYDSACGSSTFTVSVAAPVGFVVSLPKSTVSLASGGSAYLYATVASPSTIADGDYALTVTAQRAGTVNATASFSSAYKVYSVDSAAPSMFWPSPGDGSTISGRTYNVSVSASDDHAVKKIALAIDGTSFSTTTCDSVAATCQLNYGWAPQKGSHRATFTASDWLGNTSTMTVNFTVG